MSKHILQAKLTNTLAKSDYNNQDRVLAEIIQMSTVDKELDTNKMILIIPKRLNMSETLLRKTISELKKSKVLIHNKGIYKLNPEYIKS